MDVGELHLQASQRQLSLRLTDVTSAKVDLRDDILGARWFVVARAFSKTVTTGSAVSPVELPDAPSACRPGTKPTPRPSLKGHARHPLREHDRPQATWRCAYGGRALDATCIVHSGRYARTSCMADVWANRELLLMTRALQTSQAGECSMFSLSSGTPSSIASLACVLTFIPSSGRPLANAGTGLFGNSTAFATVPVRKEA